MRHLRKVFIAIISVVIIAQNIFANEQDELKEQFLNKLDTIVSIVQDTTLLKDERNKKIVELLTPTFDFDIMAKLSLGSKEWSKLNPEQRTKFVDLYVERMKQSYSSKLDSYKDQVIEITEIKQPKSNRIEIITNIANGGEKLEISYKYYKPARQEIGKDKWLIYDVSILGISILKTDRAQFSEFLQTKTIDDLIIKLSNT